MKMLREKPIDLVNRREGGGEEFILYVGNLGPQRPHCYGATMKLICWMVCMILPTVAESQSAVATVPFTTTGAFFALSVADRQASAKWYSEKLGLKVVMDASVPKSAVTVLEGGGLIVELVQHQDAKPLATAAPPIDDALYIHGIFKVGLIVDDFDATVAQLRARNVEIAYGPYPARSGQRANVIVRDHAGNLIQFFGK